MVQIAILGYGTVGSGAFLFLDANREKIYKRTGAEFRVKWILDARELDGEAAALLTHDATDILDDPEVSIVIEAMGGLTPAYSYVKTALSNGKSVVTSNKELIATHGAELLSIAKANDVNLMFEASVGGGIPLILPLEQNLMLGDITGITGILNGTTNYILSRMHNQGLSFDAALKEAQANGYAERDPGADVNGFDTARKLAILLSLALGQQVDYNDIPTTGVTNITADDFARAAELDKTIKLLGAARLDDGVLYARVAPFLIDLSHPLANVHNEYNAITIASRLSGDMMFYGKGAGKLPTASSIASDVVMCMRHPNKHIGQGWTSDKHEVLPLNTNEPWPTLNSLVDRAAFD